MTRSRRHLLVDQFIVNLASARVGGAAVNQYARRDGGDATRRENLRLYLREMLDRRATVLLVGEAPSHRGARLTGVPFMSERLMLRGVDACGLFGEARGYRKATPGPSTSTEASATMVWATIGSITRLPLLWNAFPFHPHHPRNPRSNRAPLAGELAIGQPFLLALIEAFGIETVVAVGNRARDSLSQIGVPHEHVRHPSMGGKKAFAEGIARVCQNSG